MTDLLPDRPACPSAPAAALARRLRSTLVAALAPTLVLGALTPTATAATAAGPVIAATRPASVTGGQRMTGGHMPAGKTASEPIADGQQAASWERRWLTPLDPNLCSTAPTQTSRHNASTVEHAFRVAGGAVALTIDADKGQATGLWRLDGVEAPWGWLHLAPPAGFRLLQAHIAGQANAPDQPVPTVSSPGHLALALDGCRGQACSLALRFEVELDRPVQTLRAADLLPRLGLDGDRLLRAGGQRRALNLPASLTLPEHAAAIAVGGVAPAARWQWAVAVQSAGESAGEPAGPQSPDRGELDGPLDFPIRWQDHRTVGAADLAADWQAMQACVADRTGLPATVNRVELVTEDALSHPDELNNPLDPRLTHLAAGTLTVSASLLQDRPTRLVALARALAARQLADGSQLREARGAQWLVHGLPGAVALLCAGSALPAETSARLLQQVSDLAASSMTRATADDALGAVAWARFDDWVRHYAPLSALDVMRRVTAAQVQGLMQALRDGVKVQYALADVLGAQRTAQVLGMPLATDTALDSAGALHGRHWRWQAAQWKPVGDSGRHWRFPGDGSSTALILDAWPGFERHFSDNLVRP